jgi:hypothetical protein
MKFVFGLAVAGVISLRAFAIAKNVPIAATVGGSSIFALSMGKQFV